MVSSVPNPLRVRLVCKAFLIFGSPPLLHVCPHTFLHKCPILGAKIQLGESILFGNPVEKGGGG